jgi:hypothetical protein
LLEQMRKFLEACGIDAQRDYPVWEWPAALASRAEPV